MSQKNKNMLLRLSADLFKQIHKAHCKFLKLNNMENSDRIVSKSEFIRHILNITTKPEVIIEAIKVDEE